jgi:ABC-2 type transport system ATP-binding protein
LNPKESSTSCADRKAIEDCVVSVSNLSKAFGHTLALDNVSFSIAKGSTVLLGGPNGSGKSTLLKIMCGVIPHSSKSRVEVFGLDPWPDRAQVFRRTNAMFEDLAFPDFTTGREYLSFISSLRQIKPDLAMRNASSLFNIGSFWEGDTRSYSSGMKRKIALAHALLNECDLLLLDEPFIAIDHNSRKELINHLWKRKTAEVTTVISSHILLGLDSLVDRLMVLSNGRLVYDNARVYEKESINGALERP